MIALALAMACLPDRPEDPCADAGVVDCSESHTSAPSFEVGLGDLRDAQFEPIPDDRRVPLTLGPDGGYHITIQVRATGLCPNAVDVETVTREPFRRQFRALQLVPNETAWGFGRGQSVWLCPHWEPGIAVHDVELELEVTLTELERECASLGGDPREVSVDTIVIPTCTEGDLFCTDDWEMGCAAPP